MAEGDRLIPCSCHDYILFRPCCGKEEDQASVTEYEFYICNAAERYLNATSRLTSHWIIKTCLCVSADLIFSFFSFFKVGLFGDYSDSVGINILHFSALLFISLSFCALK